MAKPSRETCQKFYNLFISMDDGTWEVVDRRLAREHSAEEVEAVKGPAAADGDSETVSDNDEDVEDASNRTAAPEDDAQPVGAPTEPEPPKPPPHPSASAIRSEAMAQARAVVDLCTLAGLPQMASRFLADATPLEDVRTALLNARAAAGAEIDPQHT